MKFSLTSFVRLIVLTASVLTLAAVGLSRAVPKPYVPRAEVPPRYFGINGTSFATPVHDNYLLDVETGGLIRLPVIDGVSLDYMACSPWRDEQGGYEVLGRATARSGSQNMSLHLGTGLGRFSLNDFRVRDRVVLNLVLTGRPCWLPGNSSRVLFAAGDGDLHSVDLVEGGEDTAPPSPRRVVWECPEPGAGLILVGDPVCPLAPALGGRVFVSLSTRDDRAAGKRLDGPQIWWLEVDPERNVVRAAGRLTAQTAAAPEERLPNLCATADGRLALAYLSRREGAPSWRLMLAAVAIDPESGDPVIASEPCDLGDGFTVSIPAFSPDGRSVFAVPKRQSAVPTVRRFSVADALDRADPLRRRPAATAFR